MNRQRRLVSACAALLLAATTPAAVAQDNDDDLPTWAAEASVAQWRYTLGGVVTDEDGDEIPLDQGTQRGDRSQVLLRVGVLFNRAWLPDLELSFNDLEGGTRTTVEGATFAGVQLGADQEAIAFSQLDELTLAARYPLSRDGIRLSAGVLFKQLDGFVTVSNADGSESQTEDYSETVPMLSVQATLAPFGPFRMRLEAAHIQADDDRATEYAARILWAIIEPFGIEAGFLSKDFRFSTDDFDVDADFRGGYFGMIGVF